MKPLNYKIETFKKRLKSKINVIKTVEMHTGGEPLRVVLEGYPEIKGNSVLEKRYFCREHLDHLRKILMHEPRGHADMYGCLITEPNDDGADFGVIFMHNEGYSTMCGHGTIAIAKLAVILGWVEETPVETKVVIDAPCGRLKAFVSPSGEVRFHNVPSFVFLKNQTVAHPELGFISFDIAYGGAFYAIIKAADVRLSVEQSNTNGFITLGKTLKALINKQINVEHPFEEDLSFLYGCIFVSPSSDPEVHSKNICIFADGEVDRCPTGSGVSARMALLIDKKEINHGEAITIESIIGSRFRVRSLEEVAYGRFNGYITEVSGVASVTGFSEFIVENDDIFKEGFLLR